MFWPFVILEKKDLSTIEKFVFLIYALISYDPYTQKYLPPDIKRISRYASMEKERTEKAIKSLVKKGYMKFLLNEVIIYSSPVKKRGARHDK